MEPIKIERITLIDCKNPRQVSKQTTGYFYEMGYSLWLFISRLFRELEKDGAKDIFFFSKEGEFLKKLFDLYQTIVCDSPRIRSHYLLVSRKSTFISSLDSLDKEDFNRLFQHYRDISINEFLQSLNFENEIIETLCRQLPVECDIRYFDLRNGAEFSQLLSLELFREYYEHRRSQQHDNLIHYLNSFQIENSKRMYLVDVGWKGSIQDNLFYLMDRNVDFSGYYIGSLNATDRSDKNRKRGILFDNYPETTPFFNVYNNNRSLFEMMLGATHGSADCYLLASEYKRETIHSHLAIHSQIDSDNSTLLVLTLDFPEERKLFTDVIHPIQENMYALCGEFTQRFLSSGNTPPSNKWFARRHARMVFSPTKAEVDLFENLYHLENFGIFEYTNFKTSEKVGFFQIVKNLINVVRDLPVLETGIWPPIILRRLGLGFMQYFDGKRRYFKEFLL